MHFLHYFKVIVYNYFNNIGLANSYNVLEVINVPDKLTFYKF